MLIPRRLATSARGVSPSSTGSPYPFLANRSMSSSLKASPKWILDAAVHHPVASIGSIAGFLGLFALFQYRTAIRRRLKMIQEESWLFGAGVTMERLPLSEIKKKEASGLFKNLKLLEMNPNFAEEASAEGWSLMTLGDYMSSLRPKQLPKNFSPDSLPNLVQREIEAGLGAALLKVLGPNLGVALLPAVGSGPIQKSVQGVAGSAVTKWFFNSDSSISASGDKGGIPIGLMTLLAGADLNAKVNSGESPENVKEVVPNFNLSAMDKMRLGEVVKVPSFVDPEFNLLPDTNFVLEKDFENTISKMEKRLGADPSHQTGHTVSVEHEVAKEAGDEQAVDSNKKQTGSYDPEDTSMSAPVPINERLLPDLHIGWGDAKCSHTKREVLKMRLLAILLNRLGSNYHSLANGSPESDLFSVQISRDGPKITKPSDLVKALIDTGHSVEVVPSSRLTTFGVSLCVKEPDNSWTNVPLGVFLESGFEDREGNMAPAMMPHSGLDMYVSGPFAGSRADGSPSQLRIQHFIGIEGFCGWKSHENPVVPFSEAVESVERLSGEDAVRAARVAGLYANVLNGLATDLQLPFGGYGLTSVCNDSAALIQQCLYGGNSIYPMTSIGKFMHRTLRYAQKLREKLSSMDELEEERMELCRIIQAMKELPNDIDSAPSNSESAARRMLKTIQPRLPFMLNNDTKKVAESLLEEEESEKKAFKDRGTVINGSTAVPAAS